MTKKPKNPMIKQRSPEWHEIRGPRINISRLGDVLADPSTKRYKNYMQDIKDAIEGVPQIEDEKPWFEHGKRLEPYGIGRYEWETGYDVQEVGIIIHPKYDFIAGSPDGKVNKDGGVEGKCHKSYKEYRKIELKGMPAKHRPQVQGSLWLTDRKWWDYFSYYSNHGKTFIYIQRIEPDIEYHKKLEAACLNFWEKVREG